MDENRLDGNAAGGLLGEIFPYEMTTAQVTCSSCGSLWRVGRQWSTDTTWVRSCAALRATTPLSALVEGRDATC
jgi:Family of unknown function (DUF6510)